MAIRSREVVGPPMDVVARPTLTPRNQTRILRTNFRPRFRGYHLEFSSNYVRFGSNDGKQRPEYVGAGVVVRLLTVYVGSVRLCCRASCAVYGGPGILTWLR